MRRYIGFWVERNISLHWIGVRRPPSTLMCLPTQKLTKSIFFKIFNGHFNTCDWLNHWPLGTELNLQPSPLHLLAGRLRRQCWKFQPSNLSVLSDNPTLELFGACKSALVSINSGKLERSLFWTTKDTPINLNSKEIPKVLGALC